MSEDPNKELVAQIARRPDPTVEPELDDDRGSLRALLAGGDDDWNAPIDLTMADGKTATQIIRGQIADAKAVAARWQPRPMPIHWTAYDTDGRDDGGRP